MTTATATKVKGQGGGGTVAYIGRVALSNVQPGDVFIAHETDPSHLPDMLVAGAIVTDKGGVMSHAAVVAMSMGLPFVVGTNKATKTFEAGQYVEVDPVKGTVTLVQ